MLIPDDKYVDFLERIVKTVCENDPDKVFRMVTYDADGKDTVYRLEAETVLETIAGQKRERELQTKVIRPGVPAGA